MIFIYNVFLKLEENFGGYKRIYRVIKNKLLKSSLIKL